MEKIEELEIMLLSQIQKIDEASDNESEAVIGKSRAMCDLAGKFTDIQNLKLSIQRTKLDTARFLTENGGGFNTYLGIEDK